MIEIIFWENNIYQNDSRNVKNPNRPLFYQTIEKDVRVTSQKLLALMIS